MSKIQKDGNLKQKQAKNSNKTWAKIQTKQKQKMAQKLKRGKKSKKKKEIPFKKIAKNHEK